MGREGERAIKGELRLRISFVSPPYTMHPSSVPAQGENRKRPFSTRYLSFIHAVFIPPSPRLFTVILLRSYFFLIPSNPTLPLFYFSLSYTSLQPIHTFSPIHHPLFVFSTHYHKKTHFPHIATQPPYFHNWMYACHNYITRECILRSPSCLRVSLFLSTPLLITITFTF